MAPCYAPRATLARMINPLLPSELDRLADARADYGALASRVMDGEPWPLAEAFGTQPEASFGPREVLAHVVEMLPFWLGELERVVDGDGITPVPFGRIADDALRIGMIERDRSLPLRVLFARLDAALWLWMERLPKVTDADRDRIGLHPRLGEMAAAQIAERFVLGHAEEHLAQLQEVLAAAGR